MRLSRLVTLLALAPALCAAAQVNTSTSIVSTRVLHNGLPVNGTECFQPIDAHGNPIAITLAGGGYNVQPSQFCQTLANGTLTGSLQVPDSSTDSAPGHGYRLTIYNSDTGQTYPPSVIYGITGTSWDLDTYVPPTTVPTTPAFSLTTQPAAPTGSCTAPAFWVNSTGYILDTCGPDGQWHALTSPGISVPATPNLLKGTNSANGVAAAVPGTDYATPAQVSTAQTAATTAGLSQFGYTFYVFNGTTFARNNATGNVDFSGTDAGVVIRAAINANAAVGGHLYFAPGIYNINSLVAETTSGYSNYYGIGIPGQAGTNLYVQWTFEGDSAPVVEDQFSTPVQTNGVIFYVTQAAIDSVPSSAMIDGIWQRPPANGLVANEDWFHNIDVRFPDNQRPNETAIDPTQAITVDYENVLADFNVPEGDLPFPAANTFGLISSDSGHEENYFRNSYAIGYDVGLDIRSEHTVLVNSYGLHGNHGIDVGVRGLTISHPSAWTSAGWGECARGLTLGPNVAKGSVLAIAQGLQIEDAQSGPFAPVYHAMETNNGNSVGLIVYSRSIAAVGLTTLPTLFDGGGGQNFTTLTMGPNGNAVFSSNSFTSLWAGVTSTFVSSLPANEYPYGNFSIGENASDMNATLAIADRYATNSNLIPSEFSVSDDPNVVDSNSHQLYGGSNGVIQTTVAGNGSSAANPIVLKAGGTIAGVTVSTNGNVSMTHQVVVGSVAPSAYTVSQLTSSLASSLGVNAVIVITDAASYTPGACAGGGSDRMLAVSDGSNWTCH